MAMLKQMQAQALTLWAADHGLRAVSTFAPPGDRSQQIWTWECQSGSGVLEQIDYVLVSQDLAAAWRRDAACAPSRADSACLPAAAAYSAAVRPEARSRASKGAPAASSASATATAASVTASAPAIA